MNLFIRTDTRAEVLEGDCLDRLREMEDESVHAVVTDPPAGISFMGKEWDSNKGSRNNWIAWLTEVMEEVLRVTKPGGHALVWALPRTSHWTAMALEDAGWEVRDRVTHHFGSGFPKSKNLGNGFGTALKPSTEDWWLCRKPLSENSICKNVLEHSTGALNIDGCRVGSTDKLARPYNEANNDVYGKYGRFGNPNEPSGRWPANLILSHNSIPIARLSGTIPLEAKQVIEEFFDGYDKVQELRQRMGRVSEQVARGTREVLLEGVQEPISENANGGAVGSIRTASHSRSPQEDVNEDAREGMAGAATPKLEGRIPHRQRGIRLRGLGIPVGADEDTNGFDEDQSRVCDGAPDGNGADTRQTAGETRNGASYQRSKGRQQGGESGASRAGASFTDAPGDGQGTREVTPREQPLEVLAEDVPLQWRRYFELTGENLGCQRVGEKRVKGHQKGNKVEGKKQADGWGTHTTLDNMGYADPDGFERVAAYECHEACPCRILDEQSGERKNGSGKVKVSSGEGFCKDKYSGAQGRGEKTTNTGIRDFGDNGGPSRFFAQFHPDTGPGFRYQAKASRGERNKGLEGMPEQYNDFQRETSGLSQGKNPVTGERSGKRLQPQANHHPTVKSVALMRYLVRMVTPPEGTVLDPFAGSGSTGVAAVHEGFDFVGIEMDESYAEIARRRIQHALENPEV